MTRYCWYCRRWPCDTDGGVPVVGAGIAAVAVLYRCAAALQLIVVGTLAASSDAPNVACLACAVRRSLQEREVEKEREEKKLQVEEMERMKTWEKGREVRVDSWKGFKGDEKSRTVVSGK